MNHPDKFPQGLPSTETGAAQEAHFMPSPEGLGAAIDYALAQNEDAIQHSKAARGDTTGLTGGDKLVLYPNPKNPRETITISPVGRDAEDRRFPATQGVHLNYAGRQAVGSGTYRIYGDPDNRSVQQWNPHPDLGHVGVVEASEPDVANYAGLVDAISRSSTERPAGRPKRIIRALGSLSHRSTSGQ